MADPVFGLKVAYRPYKCTACGHEDSVSTNHTDLCYSFCNNCSWTCGKYESLMFNGRHYSAFVYNGGPVTEEEKNPHAFKKE